MTDNFNPDRWPAQRARGEAFTAELENTTDSSGFRKSRFRVLLGLAAPSPTVPRVPSAPSPSTWDAVRDAHAAPITYN